MAHNIFGWSYPPGCSGPPDEDYDDTTCANCRTPLGDAGGLYLDAGFCSAGCQLSYHLGLAKWADDLHGGGTRKEAMRALDDLLPADVKARIAKHLADEAAAAEAEAKACEAQAEEYKGDTDAF
jgi:hypothetical protein